MTEERLLKLLDVQRTAIFLLVSALERQSGFDRGMLSDFIQITRKRDEALADEFQRIFFPDEREAPSLTVIDGGKPED